MKNEDIRAVIDSLIKEDVFEYINVNPDSDIYQDDEVVGTGDNQNDILDLNSLSLDERIQRVKKGYRR